MMSCYNKHHLGDDLYEGSILFTGREENATICGNVSRFVPSARTRLESGNSIPKSPWMEESRLWAMYMRLGVLYGVKERKDAGWKAEGESRREQSNQNITVQKRLLTK
jgi:hypothetical protein